MILTTVFLFKENISQISKFYFISFDFIVKELFKQNALNASILLSKSDFECQCELEKEAITTTKTTTNEAEIKNTPETRTLIEANRSLLSQLESKSQELKQLRHLIAQLEDTHQKQLATQQTLFEKSMLAASSTTWLNGGKHHHSPVSSSHNQDVTDKKTETDSLQELIVNYLSLIKSYKQLVEELDQARIDNSELKISYKSLSKKYMRLKSSDTSSENDESSSNNSSRNKMIAPSESAVIINNGDIDDDVDEIETYKSLVEKYKQKIGNLKSAYNHMNELYEKQKNESFERYNQLHTQFLLFKNQNTESTEML